MDRETDPVPMDRDAPARESVIRIELSESGARELLQTLSALYANYPLSSLPNDVDFVTFLHRLGQVTR